MLLFAVLMVGFLPQLTQHVEEHSPPQALPPGGDDCRVELPEGAPEDAVALVDGEWILLADVEAPVMEELLALETRKVDARVQEVYLQINSLLLHQEAARRQLSTHQLLQEEVASRVAIPTEEELQDYFQEHFAQKGHRYADARRDILRHMLGEREGIEAERYARRLRDDGQVTHWGETEIMENWPEQLDIEIASVNRVCITAADIERGLLPTTDAIQQRIHALRLEALNATIDLHVVASKARETGKSVPELVNAAIEGKIKRVSRLDARRFYDRYRLEIPWDVRTEEGLEEIRNHLLQKRREQAAIDYARELRENASVTIFMKPPSSPFFLIDDSHQPYCGPEQARVTVILFTDFQCGSCAWLHREVKRLIDIYSPRVRFVFRDFPLDRHTLALAAAKAAEAAHRQGKYWEYASQLMESQAALDKERERGTETQLFLDAAAQLGLDLDRFRRDLHSRSVSESVELDRLEALRLGVDATPGVFVNGRRVRITDGGALTKAIEREISRLEK